ncbi:cytochrome c oxidase assembly protein subunit 15 [Halogranum amylolyticum]|uniref:Cytochrome c oxidase assembly protein subunit 15 n=1 Tax=Halogranum amylolyticum TaxID=660520 RepID=A0A1H8RJC7_9EURY|nr:COX15/CtaA family protein [Halogranum amylolyticum]SEO66639.1 cytochrome c oxidase assembly protein subunit 15 [Halogranum amylolyticum]
MDSTRYRPDWLTFRRFAAFTTALTATLIALGVYTAATGSGLACSAQWPLCDNGLLPQTIPSFIEWFHRLVAMVTGFFILGTVGWAWRADTARRTKLAATLSVVLLPLQVSIGAVTVTLNGWLPNGYSPPTQSAHLLVALTIFTALVATTLFAYERHLRRSALVRTRHALLAALTLLPVSALVSRAPGLLSYTPALQATFVLVSLPVFAALVVAVYWAGVAGLTRERLATLPVVGLVFVHLLLGRDLLIYVGSVRLLNVAVLVAAFLGLAVVVWAVYRRDGGTSTPSQGVPSSD